jgi:hypothetical protein
MLCEDVVTFGIAFNSRFMDFSVYFANEPHRVAGKVRNETANHLLAPDVQIGELVRAEMLPEHRFRRRHHAPELACPRTESDLTGGRVR